MMDGLVMMIVLLGGGQTGDLLDYTPTEAYWQMREQQVVDAETMSAVLGDDEAGATDRLMAIRALGEVCKGDVDPVDKAEALKLLAPLADSKELFVGEYARRSIAWVKGEDPSPRAALPAEAAGLDLALLPADVTTVSQAKLLSGVEPMDLAALLPDIKMGEQSMRDMMMQQIMPELLEVVSMIGNVRVDLVTVGARLADQESATFVIVIRGQYDRATAQMMLEDELGDNDAWSFYSVGEVEVVASHDEHEQLALLMPSDELFIFTLTEADRGNESVKLPIEAIAKKLKQADRKPAFTGPLGKQVAAIDRGQADMWTAMQITPVMMQGGPDMAKVFGAFETVRGTAVRGAEGVLDIKWIAEGGDEKAVGEAAAFLIDGVKTGLAGLREMMGQMPPEMKTMVVPMIDMMESITFKHEDKAMTGGMKVDPKVAMSVPAMMMSWMFMGAAGGP